MFYDQRPRESTQPSGIRTAITAQRRWAQREWQKGVQRFPVAPLSIVSTSTSKAITHASFHTGPANTPLRRFQPELTSKRRPYHCSGLETYLQAIRVGRRLSMQNRSAMGAMLLVIRFQ